MFLEDMTGPSVEAVSVLSRALKPRAMELLARHGCTFLSISADLIRVYYPVGTRRARIAPLELEACHKIRFPDGLILIEEDIAHRMTKTLIVDNPVIKAYLRSGGAHNEQTEENNTQW